jgi:hypothetical protein
VVYTSHKLEQKGGASQEAKESKEGREKRLI